MVVDILAVLDIVDLASRDIFSCNRAFDAECTPIDDQNSLLRWTTYLVVPSRAEELPLVLDRHPA